MEQRDLIPDLFRTEFRKITSVLGRHFGMDHLEAAEDIASDTFLAALEVWTYKGIPDNPVAWLYTVAKNKARNYLKRQAVFSEKIASRYHEDPGVPAEIDLSDDNITDSQLQMLFALCPPSIPVEAQIGLSLRILCGFGIEEIANAFLTNQETISKRLFRAREKLRQEAVLVDFPPEVDLDQRLESVLTTLYLLFNEGYYSESRELVLRQELCLESMRLAQLLLENQRTNRPPVNALLALMCFHASRFPARKDGNGEMVLYQDQDETLWNHELIAKGAFYLRQAAQGDRLSKYHLEAAIAWWHTIRADTEEKWENILQLYNQLLEIDYSPVAALNRTYALSKISGKAEAIREAEKLDLIDNHYYHTLLGELYKGIDTLTSDQHFKQALELAKTHADRTAILRLAAK
jgi:RNA polymerase sigma factor (sigma-70 family)